MFTGKNLEIGLRKDGVLSFIRELDGNDEDTCEIYLKDASMYARGNFYYYYYLYYAQVQIINFHFD